MACHSNALAFSIATPLLHRPRLPSTRRSLQTAPNPFSTAPRRAAILRVRMTSAEQQDSQSTEQPSDPEAQQPQQQAPTPTSSEEQTTSAADILKSLREDSAADSAREPDENAPRSMLGVYRDVDGRSNVWAVEPAEKEDTRPQFSKTTLIAAAAGFIILALLVLPLLPFTNPDQL